MNVRTKPLCAHPIMREMEFIKQMIKARLALISLLTAFRNLFRD
jgi:hypothetical protein